MFFKVTQINNERVFTFNEIRLSFSTCLNTDFEGDVLSSGENTVLDMTDVIYCDSYFLRICLTFIKKYGKEKLTLINTGDFVKGVFKTSGFATFIDVT